VVQQITVARTLAVVALNVRLPVEALDRWQGLAQSLVPLWRQRIFDVHPRVGLAVLKVFARKALKAFPIQVLHDGPLSPAGAGMAVCHTASACKQSVTASTAFACALDSGGREVQGRIASRAHKPAHPA